LTGQKLAKALDNRAVQIQAGPPLQLSNNGQTRGIQTICGAEYWELWQGDWENEKVHLNAWRAEVNSWSSKSASQITAVFKLGNKRVVAKKTYWNKNRIYQTLRALRGFGKKVHGVREALTGDYWHLGKDHKWKGALNKELGTRE
jgi:DNA mismatch repair ATPase MutL